MCDTSHNPYFNRWFSAISCQWHGQKPIKTCHNPYFNRWFSAIHRTNKPIFGFGVTILILIDGFLQYDKHLDLIELINVTILILIDGFLQ